MKAKYASILASLLAMFQVSPAKAESYLCLAEASGGIKYLNGNWTGTRFKTEEKYLVTRDSSQPNKFKVTEVGKSYPLHKCDVITDTAGKETRLICGGLGYGMIISLSDLRYTEVYSLGYIENDKSGDNTPSISGGICSKID
jgi:hypothetical protein